MRSTHVMSQEQQESVVRESAYGWFNLSPDAQATLAAQDIPTPHVEIFHFKHVLVSCPCCNLRSDSWTAVQFLHLNRTLILFPHDIDQIRTFHWTWCSLHCDILQLLSCP